jgi:hypothetical protein
MANGENAKIWQVTRWCCTSGYCVDCHNRANGRPLGLERRARIVHANNLTKPLAERMVAGWAAYDAKLGQMP